MNPWEVSTIEEAKHAVLGVCDYDAETERHVHRLVAALRPAPAGIVLDYGCGIGRLAVPVSHRTGRVVVGYDTSESMLGFAHEHAGDARVTFRRQLPDAPETFAAAYSMLCFQHLRDEEAWAALREIVRLLIPGGLFISQFTVGETRELLCWERDPATMAVWQSAVGLVLLSEGPDPMRPTWWWQKARKT